MAIVPSRGSVAPPVGSVRRRSRIGPLPRSVKFRLFTSVISMAALATSTSCGGGSQPLTTWAIASR
ncbi:hypothetical protein ABZ917_36815 [Nonomuraea wenchangensis]